MFINVNNTAKLEAVRENKKSAFDDFLNSIGCKFEDLNESDFCAQVLQYLSNKNIEYTFGDPDDSYSGCAISIKKNGPKTKVCGKKSEDFVDTAIEILSYVL